MKKIFNADLLIDKISKNLNFLDLKTCQYFISQIQASELDWIPWKMSGNIIDTNQARLQ